MWEGGKGERGGIGESNLRSNRQKPGPNPLRHARTQLTATSTSYTHRKIASPTCSFAASVAGFEQGGVMHGGWCSHRGGPLCGVHSAVHTIHSAVHTIHGFHREGFTERGFTRVSKFGHPNFGFWTAVLGGRSAAARPRPTRSLPPPLHPRLVGSTSLCAQSGFWVQFLCELKVTVRLASSEPTVSW